MMGAGTITEEVMSKLGTDLEDLGERAEENRS